MSENNPTGDGIQVIRLRLNAAAEMFELSQTDLFSEYRNFLTGVEYCISELRSRHSRTPVRLEVVLPSSEIDPQTTTRLTSTLRRYCDHRLAYNNRERRASVFDGVFALRIGIPIAVVGLVIALFGAKIGEGNESGIVIDTVGWVLCWIGLWFPLDTLLFTPLGYGREKRVLALLREADIRVEAHDASTAPKFGRSG